MEQIAQNASGYQPVTREKVIDAAAALFADKGFGAATTRELADRLSIQRASLYHHIASKDQILFEICELAMTQGLDEIRMALDAIPESDALTRLRTLIATHLHTSLNNRDRHLTMLLEFRSLHGDERGHLITLRGQYEAQIDEVIVLAQQEGRIRADIDATHLRIVLLNMLNWSLTWYTADGTFTPITLADLLTTIFLQGAEPV